MADKMGATPQSGIVQLTHELGHDEYWINLAPTVICGDAGFYVRDTAAWADAAVLAVGQSVTIDDSPIMTIGRAPNHNYSLRIAS